VIAWLLIACAGRPSQTELVRDGIVMAPGSAGGRALADGRVLVDHPWRPGDAVEGRVGPRVAGCVRLLSVALGDVSRLVASGGEPPDTALAFSPDGRWLAIGAWTGELIVVDAWTGAERARTQLSEGMVKRVAWADDGSVLYAGEQSPDAYVVALDPADLSVRARFRLADDLGTAPAPAADDPFGAYALPGVYGLAATDHGVVAVGAHGWTDAGGVRRNRSRMWLLGADLSVIAAWPPDGPADAIFGTLAVDGGRLAVAIRRSAAGAPPSNVPVDGVQVLSSDHLAPLARVDVAPLQPWYSSVFVGDALALRGDELAVGTGDGRLLLASAATGQILAERDVGTPVSTGAVPVAATVGWLSLAQDGVMAVTTRSAIPYGAASPDLRPPSLHPAENGLWSFASGSLAPGWSWQGPQTLQGLVRSANLVVVGAGAREGDERTDLFGVLVFDLARPPADRLAAICPVSEPVFFRPAVAADGRIAVAEVPALKGGAVEGSYRVSVWR
jgi:hypothetical protein